MKNILFLLAGFGFSLISNAQPPRPINIGEIVPDVPFKNMINNELGINSIAGLKGKLVILDFWSTWCRACIAAIPKMEALQKQFDGELQIILINAWEDRSDIESRLSKIKGHQKDQRLSLLPTILGDSAWKEYFPHASVPHHVWLSKTGKVIAITGENNATPEQVQKVLRGDSVAMSYKQDLKATGYDVRKHGLLMPGHSAIQPSLYSGFFPYNPGYGGGGTIFIDTASKMYNQLWLNNDIRCLYYAAYHRVQGEPLRILIETKDQSPFIIPEDANQLDEWKSRNLYSYQMSLPENEKHLLQEFMRTDLNRFFKQRGVKGNMEPRKIQAFVMKQKGVNHLSTNGGLRKQERVSDSIYRFTNTPFINVVILLRGKLEDMATPIVFLDETGFSGNVDIVLYGDLRNIENVRKQLIRYGIELKNESRTFDVLIIRDVQKVD